MEQTQEELSQIKAQAILMEAFDSISKGIRPPKMSRELFLYYRKLIKGAEKERKRGVIVHVSKIFGSPQGSGVTYYKPKES